MPKKIYKNKYGIFALMKSYKIEEFELGLCPICIFSDKGILSEECVFCRKNMSANEYFISN